MWIFVAGITHLIIRVQCGTGSWCFKRCRSRLTTSVTWKWKTCLFKHVRRTAISWWHDSIAAFLGRSLQPVQDVATLLVRRFYPREDRSAERSVPINGRIATMFQPVVEARHYTKKVECDRVNWVHGLKYPEGFTRVDGCTSMNQRIDRMHVFMQ